MREGNGEVLAGIEGRTEKRQWRRRRSSEGASIGNTNCARERTGKGEGRRVNEWVRIRKDYPVAEDMLVFTRLLGKKRIYSLTQFTTIV